MNDSGSNYKFVFTGGHHNSALSVARELISRGLGKVVWYGHKYTMLGDKNESAEFKEVTQTQITFRELKAGKLYKTFHPLHWLRVPYSVLQSFWYLIQDRPDLVVSFGGYLAAPVILAAWILRIPIVTHEQTTVVGLSNRFISRFAKQIFITWPQSKKYFDTRKVVLTGLPLRQAIFNHNSKKELFDNQLPVIYVTGGKQGSHVINEAVGEILPELLTKANLIHQCGSNTLYNDFEKLNRKRDQLPAELQRRHQIFKYIFEDQIGQVFYEADLVISRAGAHTVYEVAALGKPVLFIPIPWASHNEQYKNARILVNEGSAALLPEDRLDAKTLLRETDRMLDSLNSYKERAAETKSRIIYDARQRIVDEITTLLTAQTKA